MKKILIALAILFIGTSLSAQENYDKHVFSMNAGYAFKFTKEHPQQLTNTIDNPEQVNRIRHGINLGLDYDYRFSTLFSAGLKASMFTAFHSFENTINGKETLCSNDFNIFYAGPSFKAQLPTIADKIDIWARATVGYMKTRISDKALNSITYSGDCLGYGIEAGVGYMITKNIGISFNAEFLGGQINTFKFAEEEIDISATPENLSRLNLSFGAIIKL